MRKTTKKSTQIGIRIDNDLLHNIERLAALEGVDKMTWMRKAFLISIKADREMSTDDAIADYIHLRITEEQFLNITKMGKIPKDIEQARKDRLTVIKNGDN